MPDAGDAKYLLDSNIFIQPYRTYYSMKLGRGYWDFLEERHSRGEVCSIDRVRDEIREGDDLHEWILSLPESMFLTTDDAVVGEAFGYIMAWAASHPNYSAAAYDEFSRGADGWLIAYASVNEYIVATMEVSAPEAKSKIHIPDACENFDVSHVDLFSMLDALDADFL